MKQVTSVILPTDKPYTLSNRQAVGLSYAMNNNVQQFVICYVPIQCNFTILKCSIIAPAWKYSRDHRISSSGSPTQSWPLEQKWPSEAPSGILKLAVRGVFFSLGHWKLKVSSWYNLDRCTSHASCNSNAALIVPTIAPFRSLESPRQNPGIAQLKVT